MGWWKTAQPGDKIVCIDDSTTWPIKHLQKGQIYTVHEIREVTNVNGHNVVSTGIRVRLKEVMFSPFDGVTVWCPVIRFRPVQTKSTDAAMKAIRSLLNTREMVE